MTPPNPSSAAQQKAGLSLPTLGLLPVAVISAAVAGPAMAQTVEETITLDTVHIVGQNPGQPATDYRVNEGAAATLTAPLLDTPRTVKVITQRQIEERGATSVEDVLRTTPGVTLGSGEGGTPFGTRPYMRGFEAAFSMAVDGVRTRGRTTYEAFNLETIEVNMGSDGVTAGAGSAAGSINMTSKEPHQGETFHNVSATAGNASQKRLTYDGNVAISDDITARLNLMWQDSGVPGSKYVTDDKRGIAPAISWQIGADSRLTFKVQHVKETGRPGARVPFANATWNANQHLPGWADYGWGTPDDPYVPLENIDRNNYYGIVARDFRDSSNTSAQLKFEHRFQNNLQMTSTLSWIGTDVQMGIMRPSITVADDQFLVGRNGGGGMRYSNRETETLNFHTNFRGDFDLGGAEHSVSFGLEATRDRVWGGATPTAVVTTPGQPGWGGRTPLFNPGPHDPFVVTGSFGNPRDNTPATTETKAVYLFDTITFNEQWMANAGIRVERFKITGEDWNGAPGDDPISWGDTLVDYQIGVMYKPLPNATIYASYNTTSSPPGACAEQGGGNCPTEHLSGDTITTDAEKTRNFELGAKWDLYDGNLSLTAALFRTEKDNQRVQNDAGDYVLNVGSSRGQGVDLGIAGRIDDRWSVVAGYTYLDAKVKDGGPLGTNVGMRPINTAMHTFALWTTYEVNDQWTIGGGANYVSRKYVNPENTYAVPSYWRVDAMASYRINDQTSVQVNINNLFDERYYDSSHVGSFATLQPGRSISAKLSHRF